VNSPEISVIIPVYNSALYLRKCLDTVIGQTLREIEIICVDDGSTDDSTMILEEYARLDERLAVIVQQKNTLGAGRARNSGLRAANGKYLSFLDSDDFFAPDMLEKLLKRGKSNNADIVICNSYGYDHVLGTVHELDYVFVKDNFPGKDFFSYKDIPEKIFQTGTSVAWNKLFKTSFVRLNKLLFQEDVAFLDDIFFTFVSLVVANRISVLDERLVYYRMSNCLSQTEKRSTYKNSAFLAGAAIKKTLVALKSYEEVQRSFYNWWIPFSLWYIDSFDTWDDFLYFYNRFKTEHSNISEQFKDYFYDRSVSKRFLEIMSKEPEEYLYTRYRKMQGAGGVQLSEHPFPEYEILKGKNVVLYGAGKVGRSWYAQLILNRRYNVVAWVDKNFACLKGIVSDPAKIGAMPDKDYDYILIAIEDDNIAKQVEIYLGQMNIPSDKILRKSIMEEER
jgi:glycosyltransferase involved in cell wall biosynthesis